MKKIFLPFAVLAIAGAAYFGVNAMTTKADQSLLMQNVEALAGNENGGTVRGVEIVDKGSRIVYDDKGREKFETWCFCIGSGSLYCPC